MTSWLHKLSKVAWFFLFAFNLATQVLKKNQVQFKINSRISVFFLHTSTSLKKNSPRSDSITKNLKLIFDNQTAYTLLYLLVGGDHFAIFVLMSLNYDPGFWKFWKNLIPLVITPWLFITFTNYTFQKRKFIKTKLLTFFSNYVNIEVQGTKYEHTQIWN